MDNTVLSLGRTFDRSPGGRRGRRPRLGAFLVAGLIASGVSQLPSSAVAAPAPAQRSSVSEVGGRAPVADATAALGRVVTRPRLSVDNDTVFEGDDAKFELRLSKSTTRRVTVHYFTEDGSARGGSDYEEVAGSRSFRPGIRRATVSVETFKDRRHEGDQTFFLHLFQVRGATLNDSVGRATILDRNRPNPQPCHPRCNPPCHPFCPPPCHPNCPPPCHPFCPPSAVPAELSAAVSPVLPATAVPAELSAAVSPELPATAVPAELSAAVSPELPATAVPAQLSAAAATAASAATAATCPPPEPPPPPPPPEPPPPPPPPEPPPPPPPPEPPTASSAAGTATASSAASSAGVTSPALPARSPLARAGSVSAAR